MDGTSYPKKYLRGITILFNSFAFLYFIIIVLLGIIIIKNKKYKQIWLLIASYFFYWYSSELLISLLIFSTLLDFNCGKAIYKTKDQKKRKFYLIVSLIGNLGLLGIFKYTDFSISALNYFSSSLGYELGLPLLNIVLPIGISFYTFQTLSYTLDIYLKKMKPTNSILEFGLYVAFFPQLVAGPIVRACDFIPQLRKNIRILPDNLKAGLTLVMWGLVKKIIFADNIAIFVNGYFADPTLYPGSIPAMIATLGFGIQIYCDFSGYSDIAIGVAKILGFNLRLNFDKPYFATNISMFWKKWHISLSSWLQDYLYIPLGGNRKGKTRTHVNLMITMILGGLWHGAAWNFLFWGIYQGTLLLIHKMLIDLKLTRTINIFKGYKKYVALFLTQYFVFMGWILFRVSNIDDLKFVVIKYITFDFSSGLAQISNLIQLHEIPLIFLATFLLIHIYTFFNRDFIDKIAKTDLFNWGLYLFIMCLALYFLSPLETVEFIYFQF
ncbi:MAG: MBOAT family protein [Candidatus Aenigmarchaeota archaeon]|nr:MBOAT family protein [Candidatus Aenigmarchaeota archaeon]